MLLNLAHRQGDADDLQLVGPDQPFAVLQERLANCAGEEKPLGVTIDHILYIKWMASNRTEP